jgi:cell division septum initiation protein DivIVA
MGRRIGVGAVVGCMAALAAGPALLADAPSPPPDPTALWRAYPLTPPPPPRAPAPPPPAVTTGAPTPRSPVAAQRDRGWTTALLAVAGLLLVLATSVTLVVRRTRRSSARHAHVAASPRSASPEELVALARALANEAAECNTFVHRQRQGGTGDMGETTEHEPAVTAVPAPSGQVAKSYADIGDRVAGVLSAAEDAAQQIRADARTDAEGILGSAKTQAERLRREAEAYDAEIRGAVETFASERRREADAEIQRLLTESETQARATRQAAEAMARQIEADGVRRGQALRDESKVVEERLKKALVGFRRITAELEDLVGAGAPGESGESLADALKPYGRTDERKPLAAVPSDDAP